jgi:hypothetical protein
LSSKRMVIQIIIANIIRTTRIIKIINHIVFLFRKCSHLQETRSFLLFSIMYNTHTMFLVEYLTIVLVEN